MSLIRHQSWPALQVKAVSCHSQNCDHTILKNVVERIWIQRSELQFYVWIQVQLILVGQRRYPEICLHHVGKLLKSHKQQLYCNEVMNNIGISNLILIWYNSIQLSFLLGINYFTAHHHEIWTNVQQLQLERGLLRLRRMTWRKYVTLGGEPMAQLKRCDTFLAALLWLLK